MGMAHTYTNVAKLAAALALMLLIALPLSVSADEYEHDVEVFVSDEVGASTDDDHAAVDELDQEWREALIEDVGVDGSDIEQAKTSEDADGRVTSIETDGNPETTIGVSVRDITDLSDVDNLGEEVSTQGREGSDTSSNLSGSAPKPESLIADAYFNHTSGSDESRNGVLFSFSDPVAAFGAWFGDLETSTDTPALLRVYDESNMLIGDEITIPTSTEDESVCDGSSEGCGNQTTRWVGFIAPADQPASSALAIVGDDNGNGFDEDFSAIGFSLVRQENRPVAVDDTEVRDPETQTPTDDQTDASNGEGGADDDAVVLGAATTDANPEVASNSVSATSHESTHSHDHTEQLATTGVSTQLSFIVGAALLLVAVTLRRFAKSSNR